MIWGKLCCRLGWHRDLEGVWGRRHFLQCRRCRRTIFTGTVDPPGMSLEHAESIIARGHAMITKPQGLGIMVAPPENAIHCPAGWMFVSTRQRDTLGREIVPLTVEELLHWVRNYTGRESWPRRERWR